METLLPMTVMKIIAVTTDQCGQGDVFNNSMVTQTKECEDVQNHQYIFTNYHHLRIFQSTGQLGGDVEDDIPKKTVKICAGLLYSYDVIVSIPAQLSRNIKIHRDQGK